VRSIFDIVFHLMLSVVPIRAFADNYIWRIQNDEWPGFTVVVDPGDADPVINNLDQHGLALSAILITHHHSDHVGGICRLIEVYGDVPVFGPAHERIPGITQRLGEGDLVTVPAMDIYFQVLDVPGHTAGHIAYFGYGALFCGDTVFAGGCGRIFDGTFEQLAASLQRIAKLPPQTLIYCAHEYTVDNLGFAKWVEPENPDLLRRDKTDVMLAEQGKPTVPSTLELELKTNPFLRLNIPTVVSLAEQKVGRPLAFPYDVFKVLRQWKDSEYD
jgi:hydroxyacylglutathione hydrolase